MFRELSASELRGLLPAQHQQGPSPPRDEACLDEASADAARGEGVRFRNSRSKVACSPSAVFYVDLSPTLIAGHVDRRHIEMFPILSCNNSARLNSMFMARFRVHGAYTLCHTYIAFCVTVYIYTIHSMRDTHRLLTSTAYTTCIETTCLQQNKTPSEQASKQPTNTQAY